MGIMFKPEFIPKIIDESKTQTRRLVKEGEQCAQISPDKSVMAIDLNDKINLTINTVLTSNGKIKWYVGQVLSVQSGTGKPAIWYCPKCLGIQGRMGKTGCNGMYCDCDRKIIKEKGSWEVRRQNLIPSTKWKPLSIRITVIRKEKLLDITEGDAKKEGFNNKGEFLMEFVGINWNDVPKHLKKKYPRIIGDPQGTYYLQKDIALEWNPEVWVLEW